MSLEYFRAAVEPFRELGFDREEVEKVDDIFIPRKGFPDVAVRLYRPAVERPRRPEEETPLPVLRGGPPAARGSGSPSTSSTRTSA